MNRLTIILLIILSSVYSSLACTIPQSERDALMALYNATDGTNWTSENDADSTNDWNLANPIENWFGLTIDCVNNTVIKIEMLQSYFNGNNLSGTLPIEIGDFPNLTVLNLKRNNITGTIPHEIGNLSNLKVLDISYNNTLSGSLPIEIGNLTLLEILRLQKNQLTGNIPTEIGNLTQLRELYINSNSLTGVLPIEIGNLVQLLELYINHNDLTGGLPTEIGNLTSLQRLDTGWNLNFGGSLPSTIGNLIALTNWDMRYNKLIGSIPVEIGNMISLQRVYLNLNRLSGNIPAEIGNLPNIRALVLSNNRLSGSIPTEIGNLTTLNELNLGTNQLTGNLPTSLRNLTNLGSFTASRNQLSSSIPSEFSEMISLQSLRLSDNQLTGNIPLSLGDLSVLKYLELGTNQISGTIPSELAQITTLETLNLKENQLQGTIPISFANHPSLKSIWVNNNLLSGTIPSELGTIPNIRTLSLSKNNFTGIVPNELINLSNLTYLDISHNNLQGVLPSFTYNNSFRILKFGYNAFQFGDFENDFSWYSTNLSTYNFYDHPQIKIDEEEVRDLTVGSNTTMLVHCNGTQNNYQWYKDGILISDGGNYTGTQTTSLQINNMQLADTGVYHCKVTSTIVTDLTILRNTITLNVAVPVLSPNDFVTTWKTDNLGASNETSSTSIAIPTTSSGYNYDVDWNNDGVFDEFGLTGSVTHDFGTVGTYTIRIQGDFPRIYFANGLDKLKIISIDQWGTQQWSSMNKAFYGCKNLIGNATDMPDLSNVSDTSEMFRQARAFNQNINNWNTSNVQKMIAMFMAATSFNQPLNDWNTSNVTDMSIMFRGTPFNQDISSWNTANVKFMSGMFQYANDFNQDISGWNTINVKKMDRMFLDANSFNQNIGTWNTSSVITMEGMFEGASAFNGNIGSWNTSRVTTMETMFKRANTFNQNLNTWNTSSVTNMKSMFMEASVFNNDIGNWNTSNVIDMTNMFARCGYFNKPIGTWNTSSLENINGMFQFSHRFNQPINDWNVSNITDMIGVFWNANDFNQDLSSWNTTNITNMSHLFYNAVSFNQDISMWDTQNVSNMESMFINTPFNQDIGSWNINNLTNASFMFNGATLSTVNYDALLIGWQSQQHQPNVTFSGGNSSYCAGENARGALIADGWSVSDAGLDCTLSLDDFVTTWKTDNLGISNNTSITIPTTRVGYLYDVDWNNDGVFDEIGLTGNVTHDYGIGNEGIKTIRIRGDFPSIYFNNEFDKDKILSVDQWGNQQWRSLNNAFYGCTNLNGNDVQITPPDLSHVINMEGIFKKASNFNQNINNWDVSNIQIMNSAFNFASSFNQPLNNWNTSNVTTFNFMFIGATAFNQDISSWNTSQVTNMYAMFKWSTNFNKPLNNWDTSNVETMGEMFYAASTFNQSLNNWNTSKVTNMYAMFWGATVYNSNINSWDTSKVIDMSKMFGYAKDFNQNIGNWDTSNVTDMHEMFIKDKVFNQNISNWNTSNVTNMKSMFWGANAFNQPIGSWNTSSVTNMAHLFRDAHAFNQNINTWNIRNVTTLNDTFSLAIQFNMPLNNWNTTNVTDMHNCFRDASVFNQDISTWQTANATDMSYMFASAEIFNQNIGNWNVNNVTNMKSMFNRALSFNRDVSTWQTHNVSNMERMFDGATAFNQNIGSWNISSLTNALQMFNGVALSTANYDALLIGWEVQPHKPNVPFSGGRSKYCMGESARTLLIDDGWSILDNGLDSNCTISLSPNDFVTVWKTDNTGTSNNTSITIPTIGTGYLYDVDWNNDGVFDETGLTGNVTHDYGIGNEGIKTIRIRGDFPRIYFNNEFDKDKILSVDQWGNQIWISMNSAFKGCSNLHILASDAPDLSNTTNLSLMFKGCISFNENINHWDVSNILNMSFLFYEASNFNQPLNNWNTSQVIDINGLFREATNFNQPLNSWNTSNITSMSTIFYLASSFNQPLDNWNTAQVTTMFYMFYAAHSFNQPISNWNTSQVSDMRYMFAAATTFNTSIENWNTSNVLYMQHMFNNAQSFNQNLENWNINSLIDATGMFNGVALSTVNYDALLIGWQSQPHQPNVTFSGGMSKYCNGESARNNLIADGWDINDRGLDMQTTPSFTQVPAICEGDTLNALPTTSDNGIEGIWSPALNNTATTEYTFTSNVGQCASETRMTITVNPTIIPSFTQVSNICEGDTLNALPTTSDNGITGVWSPALDNTATTEYTFTPNVGQCASETQMTITVNTTIIPSFTQVSAICEGETLNALPTTSDNGIAGIWSPALNNTATTEYTFTPDANQCALETQMTIMINSMPIVDELDDVIVEGSFELSHLENGNYFTESLGFGNALFEGDIISTSQTIYIYNERNDCFSESDFDIVIEPKVVVEYMHFFTPNGNGENDYWHLLNTSGIKQGAKIHIFNRFGKMMAQINPNDIGWDGTYLGRELPSSEYWFSVKLIDGRVMKGNFSLLRK